MQRRNCLFRQCHFENAELGAGLANTFIPAGGFVDGGGGDIQRAIDGKAVGIGLLQVVVLHQDFDFAGGSTARKGTIFEEIKVDVVGCVNLEAVGDGNFAHSFNLHSQLLVAEGRVAQGGGLMR